jgi:hypothetical protein
MFKRMQVMIIFLSDKNSQPVDIGYGAGREYISRQRGEKPLSLASV